MKAHSRLLDIAEIQKLYWDVIVVGTGMGGATTGYELARRGKSVLFLEKGKDLRDRCKKFSDITLKSDVVEPEARLNLGLWPAKIRRRTNSGTSEFFAPLGCGTGGSAILYAAQLERMSSIDFNPRLNFPNEEAANLPNEWPLTYEGFTPYYRKAEKLYGVCGSQDSLNLDNSAGLRAPPPMSPRDDKLFSIFRSLGLHPYRAHVACDYIGDCSECGGVICPNGCKNDPVKVCLTPALKLPKTDLVVNCEVVKLESRGRRITGVLCKHNDQEFRFHGKVVVLAAGALHTPQILLRSKSADAPNGLSNSSDLVGRNLMWHASDFIGLFPIRRLPEDKAGPMKAISLNDFYITSDGKLGTIQSVGVPITQQYILSFLRSKFQKGPYWQKLLLNDLLLKLVSKLAAILFKNVSVFATVVEDLPYLKNRVKLADDGVSAEFIYHYPDELRKRCSKLRKLFRTKLWPHFFSFNVTGKNNINFGHACGTCRFGKDPSSSVLNEDNRSHDIDNLYVTDSSFFPTSSGTNPSLTIAANAIRVAERINESLEVA